MKRKGIAFLMLLAVCGVSGCRAGSTIQGNRTEPQSTEQRILEESEKIAEDYRKIYEAAVDKGRLGQREVIGEIVERLGECGYTVVDSANQIDMVNAKEAEAFCLKAQNGQEAEVFLLVVTDEGGFVRYDLRAFQGKIKVRRSLLRWENGAPEAGHLTEYTAYTWSYTEKGYLFLEEYHPSGFDGPSGHTAIRIKPLDASCREWNRKCLEMVGYGANNLFVSDWSEPDFQSLNFCDLYEILYRMKHGRQAPYDFKLGRVCVEIPEKEFEEVFTEYFRVDAGILKQKMTWHEKTGTYQYRARGIYDCGNGTEPPYPEVTDVCENADGTVKLTVHAVWAERNTDCAFSHEVTVRPLENGAFQYVSNHVIPSEMNVEPLWYKERLSDEEWTEAVGGVEISGNSQNVLEKGYNLPINKAEKERASQECLNTMNLIREQYVDSGKNKNTDEILTDEELGEMVQVLCQTGNIVIASGAYPREMQNYERMESFLNQALAGEKSKETIYEIYPSGTVCRKEFSYDGENLYLLSCTGIWQEGGTPGVSGISRARVKSWRYTEKGWFCYELCVPEPPEVTEIVDGSAMLRVKPLKEEYREIGRKWICPIGYQGNNLLCSQWDENHLEELDYNGLYEYFYAIEYQKKVSPGQYPEGIAQEEFESLMMKYLPVSAEQLRRYAVYDADSRRYGWERLGCGNYVLNAFRTSVPEVVDLSENWDGTVTLTVDAVCEMMGNDRVFSHELTVRFTENGVKYLRNYISEEEKKKIPEYYERISVINKYF